MKPALVKIDVAAAHLGWSAGKLFDLVDGGTLLEKGFAWVFNFANALDGERRDLRFWWPEIEARATGGNAATKFSSYEIEWVIGRILPEKRVNFAAGEVDQMFQLRPRTRIDFGAELQGNIEHRTSNIEHPTSANFYARKFLAAFLQRRWLGGVSVRPPSSVLRPLNPFSPRATDAKQSDNNKPKSSLHAATLSR